MTQQRHDQFTRISPCTSQQCPRASIPITIPEVGAIASSRHQMQIAAVTIVTWCHWRILAKRGAMILIVALKHSDDDGTRMTLRRKCKSRQLRWKTFSPSFTPVKNCRSDHTVVHDSRYHVLLPHKSNDSALHHSWKMKWFYLSSSHKW